MHQPSQRGFFDETFRLETLTDKNDPLVKLHTVIAWEAFRPVLDRALRKEPTGKGGRPPYDYVLMLKVLILQRLYNLSDAQMEYQITDRLSFMRFLGLSISDRIPDQNTIWLFREHLTNAGAMEELFALFSAQMTERHIIINAGSIVDATIVEVPKQRNTPEENASVKAAVIPEAWKDHPEQLRQKDTDARWVHKGGVSSFGYKNHIKVCRKSKMITAYAVTDACVHDSQVIEQLVGESDAHHELYGDSAYAGHEIATLLRENKIRNRIHEKGYRNHPLTHEQWERNRKKSKIRARVEHVFGFMTMSMRGIYLRTIGRVRATAAIGLMNLTYNLCRYVTLTA